MYGFHVYRKRTQVDNGVIPNTVGHQISRFWQMSSNPSKESVERSLELYLK